MDTFTEDLESSFILIKDNPTIDINDKLELWSKLSGNSQYNHLAWIKTIINNEGTHMQRDILMYENSLKLILSLERSFLQDNETKKLYQITIKKYLGEDVEFLQNGSVLLPKELKNIIFNITDEKQSLEIQNYLPTILANWQQIRQYLFYKKANSILNGGFKVRVNSFREILNALDIINRPIPLSASAQNFELLRGSELIGMNVSYPASPSAAVQRAHNLAEIIENSNNTIDIVFMTSVFVGDGGLNVDNKIFLESYFTPYTEGELSSYKNMYTNLDQSNIVLAAKVNGTILTEKEFVEWYKKECNSSPKALIQKLNLHMGKRTQEFSYAKEEVENISKNSRNI